MPTTAAAELAEAAAVNAAVNGFRVVQEGAPLCTCTLGRFGGIEVADPSCPAPDCDAR